MPTSPDSSLKKENAALEAADAPSRVDADAWTRTLQSVLRAGCDYGHSDRGEGRTVLVEFVSAPPNVPLSAAHARGGAVGDVLAALQSAVGFSVQREFYVNDAEDSRPLRLFGRAVWARYQGRVSAGTGGETVPEEYGGESAGAFAGEIAERLYQAEGDKYVAMATSEADFARIALRASQDDQRDALDAFGIHFDQWTRESDLNANGAVAATVGALRAAGYAHTHNGALWLQSSRLGDESDRALLRADGAASYLAADLAYHRAKFERGFERLIDVWSADHAGYVARTRAGLEALGFDPTRLTILLFQSVRVLKDGTAIRGSGGTASGSASAASAFTLRELIADIGADAARFQLVLLPPGEPIDLDLDAAKRPDSPLHRVLDARDRAKTAGADVEADDEALDASLLTHPTEQKLLQAVADFPAVVEEAAQTLAPQQIPAYALTLAEAVQSALGVVVSPGESTATTRTRAALFAAAAIALDNALILMGISATE